MEDTIKQIDKINDKLKKLYEIERNKTFERNIELEALNHIDFIIDKYTNMKKIIYDGFKDEESFKKFWDLQFELRTSNKVQHLESLIDDYFRLKRIVEYNKTNKK